MQVKKFLASQAVLVAAKGVPGIYIHSLLGSRSDIEAVTETGIKREINREKLLYPELERDLADPGSLRRRVLDGYLALLKARRSLPALNPYGAQEVLGSDARLLTLRRRAKGKEAIVLINLSREPVEVKRYSGRLDAVSGKTFSGTAEPYGVYFLSRA